jgi:hypothetical protein
MGTANATNHGYCYEGDYGYKYYVNYDKTDLLECHGGKDIIYKWVAESELIIKFRTGMEYGRYKVYIKKVNDKFYYSERDMLHWIEVEPNLDHYLPFCSKVEEYIMMNDEEEIKK